MQSSAVGRAVIYARLSISTSDPLDNSDSITRQIASCRKYAESRGWEVVAVFIDDGVSATKNRPEDRKGWQDLLALSEPFDAVVCWKVDRLARRVLDFLVADRALQARGAALVAVEDPIDMTTAQGRAFATILAVFAEMEADAIGTRVRAARSHAISQGLVVGGRLPYGYMSVRRGDGLHLVQDPERIEYLRTAAQMILAGKTVRSVVTFLDESGAPLPRSKARKDGGWHWSTVDKMLRNPVLWGATLDNPGNTSKVRGPDVRRDSDGLPIVNEVLAIMTPAEHRRLVELLDSRERPRSTQTTTSVFFSRLVTCGHCERTMHRTRKNGRPSLVCPACSQTVSTDQLRILLSTRLLSERGNLPTWEYANESPDTPALDEIDHAIRETTDRLADDDADMPALLDRLEGLKRARAKGRSASPYRRFRMLRRTVSDAWGEASTDLEAREVLMSQLTSLKLFRGGVGRRLDPARVHIEWLPSPDPDGMTLPNGHRLVPASDGSPKKEIVIGDLLFRRSDREWEYYERPTTS